MKKTATIMNFSGIYQEETFYENQEVQWLDCCDIPGVNGYCSDDAREEIKKRMKDCSYEGVHFLDSGNYHYLSKFWLEKIQQPFSLVVFDHHTDMQESAFWGMLSCGSWIKEVLEENDYVQEVCIIGPPEEAVLQCQPKLASRVVFITEEELREGSQKKWRDFLEQQKELPVYLSVDKDVLCQEDARTNWDQGEMKLEELERMAGEIFIQRQVLGTDICGENPQGTEKMPKRDELKINDKCNKRLWEMLG